MRFLKHFQWINSIAFRLSASIALVVLATALTIASLILTDEQKTLEDRLRIRALQLGEIMSRQMVEPLLYEERYTIFSLFSSYIKTNESIIVYAEAYDDHGQFLLRYEHNIKAKKLTADLTSFSEGAEFVGRSEAFSAGEVIDLIYPITTQQLGLIGYLRIGITPQQLLDTLANIEAKVLKLTALIVVCGILAGLWMARKLIRPVLLLNRAVLAMNEETLGSEIGALGIGEIRELSLSFNAMSKKLKEAMLANKAAQDSLIRKEKLYVLGEFSAGLAHEIKNPLTPIKMLIQRAREQQVYLQGEDLDVIISELNRIDTIVNQFLGLARSSEQNFQKVDINKLIGDVLTITRRKIEKAGIDLQFNPSTTALEIQADPGGLTQVFINLILNAIQATAQGGWLKIKTALTDADGSATIKIEDSGCGIPAEQLNRVFDPLFTTKYDGTGLGLAVVWNVIQKHNGHIDIASQPQVGTSITVKLPHEQNTDC